MCLTILVAGCAGNQSILSSVPSETILPNYNRMVTIYLDEATKCPTNNDSGEVVWNTRYYLESLLTAHNAAGSPDYLDRFRETGECVMKFAPWPTQAQMYGIPIQVGPSLYAQSMNPSTAYVKVGSETEWLDANQDALGRAILGAPLVWNNTPLPYGRLFGSGPAISGLYDVSKRYSTAWDEQTGGILLPFAKYLQIQPDPKWLNTVLSIATENEKNLEDDGKGGLVLVNSHNLPNLNAGVNSCTDYTVVEIDLRYQLYKLTGNVHQLEIARRMIQHELQNWNIDPQTGYLLLKFWPNEKSWNSQAEAPVGNVLDVFQYDNTTPAPVTDASFFTDMLHDLKDGGLIPVSIYEAQKQTFNRFISKVEPGSAGIIKAYYPWSGMQDNSTIAFADDRYASDGWLFPELADSAFIGTNQQWMHQYNQMPRIPQNRIGYFLRAWSRVDASSPVTH